MASLRAQRRWSIENFKSFAWLTDRQRQSLQDAFVIKQIRHKQKVPMDAISVVLSGVIRVTRINTRRKRILVAFLGPGCIMGAIFRLPRAYQLNYEAVTDCVIGMISADAFVRIIGGIELDVFTRTVETIAGQVWRLLMRYTSFLTEPIRDRLAEAMLELGRQFGAQDSRGTVLTLKITHGELADLVGCSRRKITTLLGDFERHGLIIRDGRRLILRTDQLRAVADAPAARPLPNSGNGPAWDRGKRYNRAFPGRRNHDGRP